MEEENIQKASEYLDRSEEITNETFEGLNQPATPSITQNGDHSTVVVQNGKDAVIITDQQEQLKLLKKMIRDQKTCSEKAIQKMEEALSSAQEALEARKEEIILLKKILEDNGIDF